MRTRSAFIALILVVSSFLNACTYLDPLGKIQVQLESEPDSCPANVACTRVFVFITVRIKYSDNTPVILDTYKVIQTASGAEKTPNFSAADLNLMHQSGAYPITTDEYQKEWVHQKVELEFIGYKNGQELVRRKFMVSANCCHVILLSKDSEIILEK